MENMDRRIQNDEPKHKGSVHCSFFPKRAAAAVFIAALCFLLCASIAQFSAPRLDAQASSAIDYANQHWNWSKYDNSQSTVNQYKFQPNFQCAEFVSRSLLAAGPIGNLTLNSSQESLAEVQYNSQRYNLLYVPSLYQILLDTGIGHDVGTSLQSATAGSVVIYGNLEHVALAIGNGKISAHNQAMTNYPIDQIYSSYSGYNDPRNVAMPITHIIQLNYAALAAGRLANLQIPPNGPVTMNAPAPYLGGIVTSGLTLSW
ncbi:MAG: hypothetical protein ACR2PL_04640, partial [Dehalococcoidia bacterium]